MKLPFPLRFIRIEDFLFIIIGFHISSVFFVLPAMTLGYMTACENVPESVVCPLVPWAMHITIVFLALKIIMELTVVGWIRKNAHKPAAEGKRANEEVKP